MQKTTNPKRTVMTKAEMVEQVMQMKKELDFLKGVLALMKENRQLRIDLLMGQMHYLQEIHKNHTFLPRSEGWNEDLDNALYKHDMDWGLNKPDEPYLIVYLFKKDEDSDIDEEEQTEFLFECDDKGVECLQCQKCDGWFAPCEEGLKVNLRQKETGIMVKCNFKCPECGE